MYFLGVSVMLKKRYLADKNTCKVTFTIDHSAVSGAKAVSLVGDFNNWDTAADPMKRGKHNGFTKTVELPCGDSYQFRYLIDGSIWENDAAADGYQPTPFGDSDNSVVEV
jgi:1,4-alpha-glucan branching enzyme